MEITKYQIAEFLSNKCSAEEAERIAAWLQDNPHALDDFFSEAEWEQFETTLQVDEATHLDMFARIKENQQTPVRRIAANTWWRIAAAILFFIVGAYLYKQLTNKPLPERASSKVVVAHIPREVILANTTVKKVRYQLDDGSVVVLSKNSQVKYHTPFDVSKRDVYLEGEAFFEVTKDAHRPFTVFAKGFSTTALGTSFTISAYNDAVAHVKLYTGKVVVKNLQESKNAIYLLPGGACAFDYGSANLTKVPIAAPRKPATQPAMPAVGGIEETGDYVIFNSTRLTEVMSKLGELYGVRITYDSKAIQHKKFIGKVDKKSTVEEVLQTIAVLNDLQVTNNGAEYIITNNN